MKENIMSEAIIITELLKNVEERVNKLKKENEVLRDACKKALFHFNLKYKRETLMIEKLEEALT
jgi:hypothetical protein